MQRQLPVRLMKSFAVASLPATSTLQELAFSHHPKGLFFHHYFSFFSFFHFYVKERTFRLLGLSPFTFSGTQVQNLSFTAFESLLGIYFDDLVNFFFFFSFY